MTDLDIDTTRLLGELDELAGFSDADPPAVTRIVYSDVDTRARSFLKERCREAGLGIREDALGNLFARWEGTSPNLPAVGTGSHIDAIPYSGRYDGTVGVLGGLEALRALRIAGFQPRRSLELLLFTSEEPTRFGLGCLGSRGLSGAMDPTALAELNDNESRSLDQVRHSAGFTGDLATVRMTADYYAAFVELHIEQGPLLERAGIPIGIVTAIAAPAALRIEFEGTGGHAGAVLMPERHDALCAAAALILAVEEAALTSGSPDTVATTGTCRIHPGAINSIPSRVIVQIDIRDIALAPRDRAVRTIEEAGAAIAAKRGLRFQVEKLNADPPATMAPVIVEASLAACNRLGLASQRMVSRAYHDSLYMARLCPTGMIFIPCRGGVSHRPDEFASPEAITKGVHVLALTLTKLANG
ncbi:MAG TPA: M20 family metallo-hydrolase [Gemmataceae bacterium]|jgi:N-carbamoyl-L-amino-acid hydrolase|nr:M20 family metallo-hydrolase [Gemmataceae bacterium]